MKKLAYLISRYPAVSHTFILREIEELRTSGFDIKTASINSEERPFSRLTDSEVKEVKSTYYVKESGLLRALRDFTLTAITSPIGFIKGLWYSFRLGKTDFARIIRSFFYFVEATVVGRWMKREGCTHLHVHFADAASTVALMVCEIFPFTFSITVHGPDEFYEVSQFHLKEKIIKARLIICISQYAKGQLMRLSPHSCVDKLVVCRLGVNPQVYEPKKFNLYPDPFQLLCIGRLVPSKGQYLLLNTMKILIDRGYHVILHLVGDGPDRKGLESETARLRLVDVVIFHGSLNQEETYKILRSTDIFVLPSFAEGLPIVLMEAMSMEIPCVTTAITGIPELIENGKDGILVPAACEEETARAISMLIENSEIRSVIGINGRKKIVNKFDLKKNVSNLAEIFTAKLFNK